jgi:hypothetical protein
MITKNFNITYVQEDKASILDAFIKNWNIAYRKVYSNITDTNKEDEIRSWVISKYLKSTKLYEYLKKEVDARHSADESIRMNKLAEIAELQSKLTSDNNLKTKEIKKIQKRISNLNSQVNHGITFGGKHIVRKISEYSHLIHNFDTRNKTKYNKKKSWYVNRLNELRDEFTLNRLSCVSIHGEASRNGNRFFDFKDMDKGVIIFKPEGWKESIEIRFRVSKSSLSTLMALKTMVMNKEIPLTVTFDKNTLHFSYEEGKLTGKYLDLKKLYGTMKHIKDKDERKALIFKAHREHEQRNFIDKVSNRYAGIDLNPKGIGLIIADRMDDSPEGNIKIINKYYINLSDISGKSISSTKRKHELSHAIKWIFSIMEHNKVCHLIVEDISNINDNKGNQEVNRLINNVWNRGYVERLYTKWCNHFGIKKTGINPCYSSFIGNIMHDMYDPVAASVEITRRGSVKYIKSHKFLPEFHNGVITEIADLVGNGMDDDKMEMLLNATSWKSAWDAVKSSETSVRRVKVEDFDHEVILQKGTVKSKVRYLRFQ